MDSIFGIGTTELIVILLLAGVVLGPERMARAARTLGRLLRDIKAYFRSFSDELKTEIDLMDELKDLKEVKQELNEVKRDMTR